MRVALVLVSVCRFLEAGHAGFCRTVPKCNEINDIDGILKVRGETPRGVGWLLECISMHCTYKFWALAVLPAAVGHFVWDGAA